VEKKSSSRGESRDHERQKAKLSVGFVLAQNFTLTAFAGFVDALRLASDEDDKSRQVDCNWTILGSRDETVRSSCGVEIKPWLSFDDAKDLDYVAVVGGMLHQGQDVPSGTISFLRRTARACTPVIGLCTGTFVLARAGILEGYEVCISKYHLNRFKEEFPQLAVHSGHMFVIDRDRMTCAGGVSVIHLAAHIIENHISRNRAVKVLRLLYEDTPFPTNAWQPQGSVVHQSRDEVVKQAMDAIEESLGSPGTLKRLARSLGLSVRQLERRFIAHLGMTPREYRMRVRLARGKWLIEQTQRSITDIALECGFNDCSHFSTTFKSRLGSRPSYIRRLAQ